MTPHQRTIAAIVPKLLKWFSENARDLPWRRTTDPYGVFVSEIMLQQTQVKTVLPYWRRWMRAMPNIGALARARPQKLHKLWEGLGYYTRVRNMRQAAQLILERHGGRFPTRFDDVLALPGIGPYTAGAICSIAFNQPKPILDGNVIRVLTRLFGISSNPRENPTNARLWHLAAQLVQHAAHASRKTVHTLIPPKSDKGGSRSTLHAPLGPQPPSRPCSHFNQSLMELGALVCTPKAPQCDICPVRKNCVALRQRRVSELPKPARRPRAIPKRHIALVAESRGRFLVRQRPGGAVNAHLWEFPNLETGQDGSDLRRAAKTLLGFTPSLLEQVCTVKHSITRYRITLDVYQVPGNRKRQTAQKGKWLTLGQLRRLPFASAHRRILRQLAMRQE